MLQSIAGDKAAYENLLVRVAAMVRGYLLKSMGSSRSEERAEDLVQEVLLSIHTKKHLYRPTLPILPWLFAIARYRLIDHYRSEKRRPAVIEMDETFDAADPTAQGPVPLEAALELEELLDGLTPRQREILVLAKADGVPLAEIARKFNMTLSAVKVTVHRSLSSIRKRKLFARPENSRS